jgi:hypothetical protein
LKKSEVERESGGGQKEDGGNDKKGETIRDLSNSVPAAPRS